MTKPISYIIIIISLLVSGNYNLFAQTYSPRWQYSWGGDHRDVLFTMIPISNMQYFYTGYTASSPSCTKSGILYGLEDMAAIVFDDAGNKVWERTYGGDNSDAAFWAVKVSSGGYVLTGSTSSGPSGNKTSPLIGNTDIWVVRIDDNGNLLWEKSYGSIDFEHGTKIVETPDGGFLIAGWYSPAMTTSVPLGFGRSDYQLMKIDANGNLLWKKFYGGTEAEEVFDLIPSGDGNYFLSGGSFSPANGNKSAPLIGHQDIWLVKVAPDGTKIWDKTFGTTDYDQFGRLTLLADQNILMTDGVNGTGRIRKLDVHGNQLWLRSCSGTFSDMFEMATEDPVTKNIYVLGASNTNNVGCKTSPFWGGGMFRDLWLTVFNSSGVKLDDMDFGGNDVDLPTDIDIVNDEIWITAWSDSPLGGNKTTNNCGQTADGWIIRLSKKFYVNSQTPTSLCNSQHNMKVHFTTTTNYNAGNIFTAQLSDANGNFSSPLNIGSIAAIKTDSINVIFPAGLPVSPGYKIRVIATIPADTTAAYSFWLHGAPVVNLGNDTLICQNTNLSLSSGVQPPGSQVLWNTGHSNSSIVASNPGIYWCEVQNAACGVDRDSINVNVKALPITFIGPDTSFCNGQSILLLSNPQLPDASYLWNTGATTNSITIQNGGIYWLNVSNACGSSTDSLLATRNLLPVITLDKTNFLCEGSSRLLNAGNGYSTYLWNTGANTPTVSVNNVGLFTVTVTDNNGCSNSDSTRISQLRQLPSGFLGVDTALCSYEEILLKASGNFSNYAWSTGVSSNSISVKQASVYWLQVKDTYGCMGIDTVVVKAKECPTGFYMPTGFTPNGDGKNDLCRPILFGNVIDYHFALYNRWGEKIHESKNRFEGWDGKLGGIFLETGTFVWTCTYQFAGDKKRFEKGTVILIK